MHVAAVGGQPGALSWEEYIQQAGSEGIELIMWLIMRGALHDTIRRVHRTCHVPASSTAAALALSGNRAHVSVAAG